MRHLGKNISKKGKNFKEEMPALLLRQYSKSYGVVPSRHIVLGKPNRALRTRLPSLRSVVPSRHLTLMQAHYYGQSLNLLLSSRHLTLMQAHCYG